MNTYDEVPYPIYSHVTTHPATIATLAVLYGLTPAPVERCRVLELGCASGGNLIPMALGLPHSEFVGVDNSGRQVDTARAYTSALGLKNLTYHVTDLMSLGPDLGQFDYIIAHGLYSWVPATHQEKILQICQANLAPQGIAFVSYNTLPGWRSLSVIRDMLLYHTRGSTDPGSRTARARSLINFLAQATQASQSTPTGGLLQAYAEFFRTELEALGGAHDSYLLHEMLEEVNDPIYFSEFVARAARHGLQYLGEVDFRATLAGNLDAGLSQGVMNMARDLIEWEQYVDFVKGRTFRQTLLVHEGQTISRALKSEVLVNLHIASGAQPVGASSSEPEAVQDFGDPQTLAISTDHPVTKAAMTYLAEIFPRFTSFNDVLRTAQSRLGLAGADDQRNLLDTRILCNSLLTAFTYSNRLVDLSVHAPDFVVEVGERPVSSPWARLQVLDGFAVTNMRHERIDLNPFQAYVLRYLDGNRDRATVVEALILGPVAGGKLAVKKQDVPVQDPAEVREILAPQVDQTIGQLAQLALLVG